MILLFFNFSVSSFKMMSDKSIIFLKTLYFIFNFSILLTNFFEWNNENFSIINKLLIIFFVFYQNYSDSLFL